jgi:hypothetical protein
MFSLSEAEQIEILERIARDDRNRAAQIASIRLLRAIRAEAEEKPSPGELARLYSVGNPGRIRGKPA